MNRRNDPMSRLVSHAVVGCIRLYQRVVSPWLGPVCRHYPSCSEYAIQSITTHGVLKGGLSAVGRLGTCHPFHSGHIDS